VNRQVRRLGIGLTLMFGLLFAQVAYIQVFAADRIANNPANATRQIIAEYKVQRGPILAFDGTVLALSERAGRRATYRYERRYPDGTLFAGITGFYSRIFGRSELEQATDPYLSGDAAELAISTFADLVLGRPKKGGAVVTTIDPDLQRAAAQALGGQPGAVAALDPRTGDVLAMWGNPSFDPNLLSSQDSEVMRDAWRALNNDPDRPLLSRANDELFPPGSTFKLITAAAALENGFGPDSTWPNPPELDLPLTEGTIENFGGSHCVGGASQITLAQAFQISCNVTFGEVGLRLGAERLAAQARAFGFCATDPPGQTECLEPTIPFAIPFATGRFPVPEYFEQNDPLVAISAIGQDNDLANPMQMALVASSIANRGIMMQPRLVTEIRDPQGRVIETFEPREYGRPISANSAEALRQMMVSVVDGGTGTAAQISGVTVAGKTGTAQHGDGVAPHAWFVSFAPAGPGDVPRIAVAVIVLDGGDLGSEATGGQVAAPIAKAVIEAYLRG
jgi:peptidoglycan glycosyltransferase